MHPPLPDAIERRSIYLYSGFLLMVLALMGRLIYLQVYQHEDLAQRALAQQTRTIDLSTLRGDIRDRQGRELAISVPAASLYATPRDFRARPAEVARQLAPALGEPAWTVEKRLAGRSFRWLARQIPPDQADRVMAMKIPGMGRVRESRRFYPLGSLAASLIGFVGVDNQGLAGVEYAYEPVLRGPLQHINIFTDARGHELLRDSDESPLDSLQTQRQQVVLTLDETIQHIAERELAEGMRATGSLRGLALVMDPRTGDILALATQPSFDLNNYHRADWSVIKNWAVTDTYEPGSTMKAFTVAAALEQKRISPYEVFRCPGQIKIGGWPIHDHDQRADEIRYLTPFQIMEKSSNVGASLIAARMPIKDHFRQLQRFGFGQSTESGLGGEVSGTLPLGTRAAIKQATVSYGQGVSVTPIQLTAAMASIANGGVRMRPRVVDKILDPEGQIVRSFPPRALGTPLSKSTLQPLIAMLGTVVESPKGTGYLARMPEYRAAGKTGTADKVVNGRYVNQVISSFLGFAPVERPEVVALVLFDRPLKNHWASESAAPVWGRMIRQILQYLKVKPTRVGTVTPSGSPGRKTFAARPLPRVEPVR